MTSRHYHDRFAGLFERARIAGLVMPFLDRLPLHAIATKQQTSDGEAEKRPDMIMTRYARQGLSKVT